MTMAMSVSTASTMLHNLKSLLPFVPSGRTVLATFPLGVLVYDTLFSFCKVKGSSMEPTLYNGEIIVVRKFDGI
jgi:signal peptidase I